MGKSQREKGGRGERKVLNDWLRSIWPDAHRNRNQFTDKRGKDLEGTGNLWVQVKHYKSDAPLSKLDECDPDNGKIAVLFSVPTDRKKRAKVCLYADDFLRIIQDIGVVYDD